MVYGAILAAFGATAVALSLAEMASMCVLCIGFWLQLALTSQSIVTPSWGPNIVGQQILLLLPLDSGDFFKVRCTTQKIP